jgi:hypothetical protein
MLGTHEIEGYMKGTGNKICRERETVKLYKSSGSVLLETEMLEDNKTMFW